MNVSPDAPVEVIDFFDVAEQQFGVMRRQSHFRRVSDVIHISLYSIHHSNLFRSNVDVIKFAQLEVEGSRPRSRPKRTCTEVVQKDCQARNLNREDAMDRGRWKKLIKIG